MTTGPLFADAAALGIDADEILGGLRRWVECESPTIAPQAVQRMLDLAASDLVLAGARVERLTTDFPGEAGAVLGRFPHPEPDQPGILIMGHVDTVHPLGTLDVLPFRRDGNLCYGPGIKDMKAGDYFSLYAMRKLREHGVETPLPVSILYTGDEEIGSPFTRAMIEDLASQYKYILVPEPCQDDGKVVTGRHEVARFTLTAHGTPTHAGYTPEKGSSAIRMMAEKIIAIESLTSANTTFAVGIIHGGQWSNCITTTCTAELLVLLRDPAEREGKLADLMALASEGETSSFAIEHLRNRPRWDANAACDALYAHATGLAAGLGMEIPPHISGGGSDGNFTGALGLATLDGLGASGKDHHTLNEHIHIDSLVPRTLLMANLLATLR